MGIYDPTPTEIMIYVLIFIMGIIVGRVLMAIQMELMKTMARNRKKKK